MQKNVICARAHAVSATCAMSGEDMNDVVWNAGKCMACTAAVGTIC